VNHLKDLVVKANSSFSSSQKKPNQRFGLSNFVAASTDQMLMTRGGYGAVTTLLSSCIHGSVGTCDRFPCNRKSSQGNGGSNSSIGGTGSRDNGSSYFSLNDAVSAGWDSATSPGALGWAVSLGWVKKTPLGFLGAFSAGYYTNLWNQYMDYIDKVKAARSGN
tara:strand:+ start:656 stop:1144 length:489 start_codon:yes stop_codon:yes gene_type:complete